MRDILASANREILGRFVRSNVLLAFDFDGTLAPIVRRPERAMMRPRTRTLLDSAAALYPIAIISGRRRDDVRQRLPENDAIEVIGNHGGEPASRCGGHAESVRAWGRVLTTSLAALDGVFVEDKGFSLAVHFRAARDRKGARATILAAAAALPGARVIGGKQVVNILPHGAPDKGAALEGERDRARCQGAIYVGDDDNDEDAFVLHRNGGLLAIRIGANRRSAAPYFIENQRTVDDLLAALIALRCAPGGDGSPAGRPVEAGAR